MGRLGEVFVCVPAVSDLANEVQLATGREAHSETVLAPTETREGAEDLDGT